MPFLAHLSQKIAILELTWHNAVTSIHVNTRRDVTMRITLAGGQGTEGGGKDRTEDDLVRFLDLRTLQGSLTSAGR